jgi:tRNA-specific 2-thiouridylase
MFVIVGLSGGVDSSVTAYLLKKAGFRVEAVFMKNWEEDDTSEYCHAAKDLSDAQSVCDRLDIPLHQINFADTYWERVFTHFLDEYRAGRTPNPDILCNKEIKFRAFLDYAKQLGADYIATGHYVRNKKVNNKNYLLKAKDLQKDQSYFLHALTESQLAQSMFPLGELTKPEVREIAQSLGLINHNKKDSVGICFIGERKFKNFLQQYLPAQIGNIETIDGEVLGQHEGLMYYTIGQRQGLQIGGLLGKLCKPWYVAKKDIARNVLIVVQDTHHPALFQRSLIASHLHWINEIPDLPFTVMAKTRYRQPDQACRVERINENTYEVHFREPQRAITPGQSIVFYQEEICLGGGIIER